MKNKSMRYGAQVIPFSESKNQNVNSEADDMKKPQISIESYHKLNRSGAVSGYVHSDLLSRPINGMHQLYIPYLFSYIHDDISEVLEELKEQGLCDAWVNKN